MYHKHHTKAIVVGSFSESIDSSRVALFTEDFGLVYARVQAGRSINSKLRYGIQDYTLGDFSLVKGKSGWKIVSARSEKNYFEEMRGTQVKVMAVANILSFLKKIAPEEDRSHYLFSIIKSSFDKLVKVGVEEVNLIECLTVIRVLKCLGYLKPPLEFSDLVEKTDFNEDVLKAISGKRIEMIAIINESIKASGI